VTVRVEISRLLAISAFGTLCRIILDNLANADPSSLCGRPPSLPQARIWARLWRLALVVPPLLPISLAVIGFSLMRRSLPQERDGCQVISLRHVMSDKGAYVNFSQTIT
jgi:hypothetical protein